jgi:hypothetical protein
MYGDETSPLVSKPRETRSHGPLSVTSKKGGLKQLVKIA